MFQLADTLPGRGGGRDEDVRRKHDQPSTSDEEEKPVRIYSLFNVTLMK